MSQSERHERDRYRLERDRRNLTVARALVRETLSRYEPRAPPEWSFERSPSGRPFIEPSCGLFFSLAHCDGLVALALARFPEIGVDAEKIDRAIDVVALARSHFAPVESRHVLDAEGSARRDRFFDLWTLKESYIKARSMGLALPLDAFAFEVELERRTVRLERSPGLADPHVNWFFRVWSYQSQWRVALGASAPDGSLVLCAWEGAPGSTWSPARLDLRASTSGLDEP